MQWLDNEENLKYLNRLNRLVRRTTNDMEGLNKKMRLKLHEPSNLWKFIKGLKSLDLDFFIALLNLKFSTNKSVSLMKWLLYSERCQYYVELQNAKIMLCTVVTASCFPAVLVPEVRAAIVGTDTEN